MVSFINNVLYSDFKGHLLIITPVIIWYHEPILAKMSANKKKGGKCRTQVTHTITKKHNYNRF